MALETATHIADLVTTNPLGSDARASADDHLRLIKSVVKGDFAGFAGAVMVRGTEAQGAGTVDQFTVTVSPAPTAYTDLTNAIVWFQASHTSTGTPTLQVNALGYKSLKDSHGAPVAGLTSGSLYAFIYDGTNFRLIRPKADVQTFTASGTWTKYGDPTLVIVECLGAGGGGGGGFRHAAANIREAGCGGGGGAYVRREFLGSALAATVAVTIGAGGVAGVGNTADGVAGPLTAGGNGGNTTFGSLVTAYGGGGGSQADITNTTRSGGSGAGSGSAGTQGGTGSSAGGSPYFAASTNITNAVGESGAGATVGGAGGSAERGGAGGAGMAAAPLAQAAGSSLMGGAGGGAGGGFTAANAATAPSAGGTVNSYSTGGGGAAGTNGAVGTAGAAGAAVTGYLAGSAGGGGGSSTAGVGGAGGAGGTGSGGGGGGAATGGNGGAGGLGGAGACRVTSLY